MGKSTSGRLPPKTCRDSDMPTFECLAPNLLWVEFANIPSLIETSSTLVHNDRGPMLLIIKDILNSTDNRDGVLMT